MVEVVPARQAAMLELVRAHTTEGLLHGSQLGPIGQAEAVAEDSRARIQVGVAAHLR
jgi:hypothetical protein